MSTTDAKCVPNRAPLSKCMPVHAQLKNKCAIVDYSTGTFCCRANVSISTVRCDEPLVYEKVACHLFACHVFT